MLLAAINQVINEIIAHDKFL